MPRHRTTHSSYAFTNDYILNDDGWSVDARNGGAPVVNYIQVKYLPIADPSIPNETTSFGQLKGRYRQH